MQRATSTRTELKLTCPGQEELIAVPVAPDVQEDGQARQGVTEDAGEHGGAHHGVVLPAVEGIDQDGHGVAAATQGGAHQDIVGDPEAPGIAVAQVGDRAQAGGIAVDDEDDADQRPGRPGPETAW